MPRSKKTDTVGVLADRVQPDGRRKIQLRKSERANLQRQRLNEAAAVLFLDIDQPRTWDEISAELGITRDQLRELTRSEEFERAYHVLFAEIGHDPRYKAVQAYILDLVPLAMKELKRLLLDPTTPATVRLNAIKEINNLANVKADMSDPEGGRKELLKFLSEHKTEIEVPVEFVEAMKKYGVEKKEVVEGEFKEVAKPALMDLIQPTPDLPGVCFKF